MPTDTSCISHTFHHHRSRSPVSQSQEDSPIYKYSKYLRGVYTRSKHSNPACYKWMTPRAPGNKFKFINLAVISKEGITEKEADTIKKDAINGHIDLILRKKGPIEIENILQEEQGEPLTCVLIEGAPGVGKSTLAWEVCRRWGRKELYQEYSIILLVTLRDQMVHKAKCVLDLFYHRNKKLQEEVVQEIDEINGKGILILLEGLDELPQHLTECSIITDLLSGAIFPEATILITSRPSATDKLWQQWWLQISRHIQILGFTEDNIDEYTKTVLPDHQLLGFTNYLSIHSHIKSMMYIPLHCVVATEVYLKCQNSDRAPPKTLTGLYTCLVQTILIRYLHDHPDYKEYQFNSFSELPSPIYDCFKRLCSFAYAGVSKQELVFHSLPSPQSTFEHFGLMDKVPQLFLQSLSYSYNFLHLSVQEYLAAYHVSLMNDHDREQLLETVRYGDHRFNMVRFLAGITQFKNLERSLVQQVIGIKSRHQQISIMNTSSQTEADASNNTLEFLYECQDVSILDSKCSYFCNIQSYDSVHCFMALGYCMSKSSSKWHVTFSGRDDRTSGIEVLSQNLKENPHPTYILESIEYNSCSPDFIDQVLIHLPEYTLKQIKKIEYNDTQPPAPCLLKLIETLNALEFKSILHISLAELISVLTRVPSLRHLVISENGKHFEMRISDDFPRYITSRNFTPEFLGQLLPELPQQSIVCIESLEIKYDHQNQHDQPLPIPAHLPEIILRMKRLKSLILQYAIDTSLTDIIPVLSKVPTLRKLTLPKLNSQGIFLLCQWLPICKLEALTLHEKVNSQAAVKIDFFDSSIESIECRFCTTEFINQFLLHLPQQYTKNATTIEIIYTDPEYEHRFLDFWDHHNSADKDSHFTLEPLPPKLPEHIITMERLNTLILKSVLLSSLTELIQALSKVPTLRKLQISDSDSDFDGRYFGMDTLYYDDLSTTIQSQKFTPELLEQLLPALPQISIKHANSLHLDCGAQSLPSSLQELIPQMRNLNSLILTTVLDATLVALMQKLSSVPTTSNFVLRITLSALEHQSEEFTYMYDACTCTSPKVVEQLLQLLPQQYIKKIKTFQVSYRTLKPLPPCLPELIPKMESLNTLLLLNVLDTSLTNLLHVLTSSTFRELTLSNSSSFQFASSNRKMTIVFHNHFIEAIDCRNCATEYIDQIISNLQQQSTAHVKTLTVYGGYSENPQPLPRLTKLIPNMETLHTLTLENIPDASLGDLVPLLSGVITLKDLTLKTYTEELVMHLFPSGTINGTSKLIDLVFPQLSQHIIINIISLTVTGSYSQQDSQPLPSCLPEMIPRMEKLNVLKLKNVQSTILIKLVAPLLRLPSMMELIVCRMYTEDTVVGLSFIPFSTVTRSFVNCNVTVKFCENSIECKENFESAQFIDQILLQLPEQFIFRIKKLVIHNENEHNNEIEYDDEDVDCKQPPPLPCCLPELILRMKSLDTLILENVLDSSLIELMSVLPRVTTLKYLALPKLNLQSITLLCHWLPTCQLEKLIICLKVLSTSKMTVSFNNHSIETIEYRHLTTDQILPEIPQSSLAHVKTYIIYNAINYEEDFPQPPIPPCLPAQIPKMESLNTLILENVLDTSLTEVIPALSRVHTLRNLTLQRLSSDAIAFLCKWLPTCQLEKLKLPSLSPDDIEMVSSSLTTVLSLKTLEIEWSEFTSESMQAFVSMLQSNQSLTELDISKCSINGESACCLAKALYRNTRIRRLDISKNPLDDRRLLSFLNLKTSVSTLKAALAMAKMLEYNNTLEDLNLSDTGITRNFVVTVVEALHNNKALRKLDISRNSVYEGASAVAEMLQHNTTLVTLVLNKACIDSDGAAAIAEALHINTALRKLDMSNNQIAEREESEMADLKPLVLLSSGDIDQVILHSDSSDSGPARKKGALALATMLKHNRALEELDLSRAEIYCSDTVSIAESLHNNTSLKVLNICTNPVGNDEALAMAKMLKRNTSLEKLSLSNSMICSDGFIAMAEALYQNTNLRQLDMSMNEIGKTGALAMAGMLQQNTTLEVLDLTEASDCEVTIDENGIKALIESLAVNHNLKKLIISDRYSETAYIPVYITHKQRIFFRRGGFNL